MAAAGSADDHINQVDIDQVADHLEKQDRSGYPLAGNAAEKADGLASLWRELVSAGIIDVPASVEVDVRAEGGDIVFEKTVQGGRTKRGDCSVLDLEAKTSGGQAEQHGAEHLARTIAALINEVNDYTTT